MVQMPIFTVLSSNIYLFCRNKVQRKQFTLLQLTPRATPCIVVENCSVRSIDYTQYLFFSE